MIGNTIIKKKSKNKEREKILLDDLLNQLEAEQAEEEVEDSKPIEITDQVRDKMMKLMDTYMIYKAKLTKVNAIKKELQNQSNACLKDLETLMKLYGLNELIKDTNRFFLEQKPKKKILKKDEFKQVISTVLNDPEKVEKIYETANEMAEEVIVEKLKCLKYKGK